MPQSFDETFLKNADVPRSGGQDIQTVSSPSGAGKEVGGTDSPRVAVTTIQAGINSPPSSNKDQTGTQHFAEGTV